MIDPKSVISPKNKIKSEINIVIQEKGFTIATFIYGESRKIGIRWNETSPGNKGYPTSNGYPTWFVIPREVALGYARGIKNEIAYQEFLRAEEGFIK